MDEGATPDREAQLLNVICEPRLHLDLNKLTQLKRDISRQSGRSEYGSGIK